MAYIFSPFCVNVFPTLRKSDYTDITSKPNKGLLSMTWFATNIGILVRMLISIDLIIISLGGGRKTDGDSAGGHRYLDDGRC